MTDKEPEYIISEKHLFNWVLQGKITKGEADVVRSRPYHPTPEQRYKMVESVPKNGIIILGIKEDPDGAFVSRKMALTYIEREYQIRQESRQSEREEVINIIVNVMKSGQQCPHNSCINEQMSCVDCWWQWIESLRRKVE